MCLRSEEKNASVKIGKYQNHGEVMIEIYFECDDDDGNMKNGSNEEIDRILLFFAHFNGKRDFFSAFKLRWIGDYSNLDACAPTSGKNSRMQNAKYFVTLTFDAFCVCMANSHVYLFISLSVVFFRSRIAKETKTDLHTSGNFPSLFVVAAKLKFLRSALWVQTTTLLMIT